MKERIAAFGCVVLAAAVFGVALIMRSRPAAIPEETVYRSFEAAETGNVKGYMECFTEPLASDLEASERESGREQFRGSIQKRARELTGIVISQPGEGAADSDTAILTVELVFADRNEVHQYRLVRRRRQWRIADISGGETVTMPIPYGTPVVPETAPEDVAQ